MLIRQRVSRIYSFKTFFNYPITMSFATFKAMGLLRTIKAGFSYLVACIHKREEKSLEDFYINRFGKVLYQMFIEKETTFLNNNHVEWRIVYEGFALKRKHERRFKFIGKSG